MLLRKSTFAELNIPAGSVIELRPAVHPTAQRRSTAFTATGAAGSTGARGLNPNPANYNPNTFYRKHRARLTNLEVARKKAEMALRNTASTQRTGSSMSAPRRSGAGTYEDLLENCSIDGGSGSGDSCSSADGNSKRAKPKIRPPPPSMRALPAAEQPAVSR